MNMLALDSVGGASGDMLLAALVDLGADFDRIATLIQSITPEPLSITRMPASDGGLHGTRLAITAQAATAWIAPRAPAPAHAHAPGAGVRDGHPPRDHDHHHHHEADRIEPAAGAAPHPSHAPHRGLRDILTLLDHVALSEQTRRLAQATFIRLAEAEARIHGTTPDAIHFHEVGAADAIADIVGCCYALELLDIAAVRVGPLPMGCGTIHCAHGEMPNPAPATQVLLQGFDVIQTDEPFELVTPTGAALLAAWRSGLGVAPARGRIAASGLGFGARKLQRRPNVLRATRLTAEASAAGLPADEPLTVLETNLDDCNPQWIGELIGRLLELGALDAWAAPIIMKKGRPALLLGALCRPETAPQLQREIFLATPTFGIRATSVSRTALARRQETVATPYGAVRVKMGELDGRVITRTPEFADCAERARSAGVTPRQVAEAAREAAVRTP